MAERIVDLTLSLYDGMRGVSMESKTTIRAVGFNTTNLHLYTHGGTHMDAPSHFLADGGSVDQISLGKCIGPALVVDLSHIKPDSKIVIRDLGAPARNIHSGTRLLLRTDWDLHANGDDYRTHMPRLSLELARWFAEKGIALLGLDTPSVASLQPEHRAELIEIHQVLLGAEIVIVESLANLRELRQETVQFVALPLRIEGCDGSPVRAVAIEDEL